ncbi:MAG: hypothetical protein ACLRLT_16195 [Sellimonas intestinalis]|uniref:hypothetical protein n=1 Tax=Sellimonas intestinalis TaxID=1653434 RepID=UPI0039A32DEA
MGKARLKRESNKGDISWPRRRHRRRKKYNSKESRAKDYQIHPVQIQPFYKSDESSDGAGDDRQRGDCNPGIFGGLDHSFD